MKLFGLGSFTKRALVILSRILESIMIFVCNTATAAAAAAAPLFITSPYATLLMREQ